MKIPFEIQLLSGCLIVMVTLAVIGLQSLDLPTPATLGCGLAVACFSFVWLGGLLVKFINPSRGPASRGGAEGQDE